jgi:hypothetical protein
MNKKDKVIDFLVCLILFAPSAVLTAFTGMKLWNWFVSSTFELAKINMWQAYGLNLLIAWFINKQAGKDQEKVKYQNSIKTVTRMMANGLTLLMGYIVYAMLIN